MPDRLYTTTRDRLLARLKRLGLPYPARVWPRLYRRIAHYRTIQLADMRHAVRLMKAQGA